MIKFYVECPEGTIFIPEAIYVWVDEVWFECDPEKCLYKDKCNHQKGRTIKINKPTDNSS
jgi:hypothetical protein